MLPISPLRHISDIAPGTFFIAGDQDKPRIGLRVRDDEDGPLYLGMTENFGIFGTGVTVAMPLNNVELAVEKLDYTDTEVAGRPSYKPGMVLTSTEGVFIIGVGDRNNPVPVEVKSGVLWTNRIDRFGWFLNVKLVQKRGAEFVPLFTFSGTIFPPAP